MLSGMFCVLVQRDQEFFKSSSVTEEKAKEWGQNFGGLREVYIENNSKNNY